MAIFADPFNILSEAASADLLDPDMSAEVKDTIEELDDALSNNVEEIKPEDKVTNGGIPITTEMCSLVESFGRYGNAKYLINFSDILAIRENEEEAAEDAGEDLSDDDAAPDAADIVEDIAQKNGVDPDQVAIVISSEQASYLAECAINEAKAGSRSKKSKKKLSNFTKALAQLKNKGIKVIKVGKKKKK